MVRSGIIILGRTTRHNKTSQCKNIKTVADLLVVTLYANLTIIPSLAATGAGMINKERFCKDRILMVVSLVVIFSHDATGVHLPRSTE